ncbi:SDR family oxidoreductase [uncultured Ferrimonas sp.]|uniref:SDR family oxidoreductase n=1 Tax=uncultured Ferrimonas sp. TaxID=432640 RepID=UPI00263825A0|nr:SDR family oxidoreductase [uncultured Ferrimonas sp.]
MNKPNQGAGFGSVLRADLFVGHTMLITGGGSGIGRCIAHELASLGATVLLLGRTLAKLETVAAEIAADGGQAHCYVADIRDEERVQQVVAEMLAKHGAISGLVNNAGGQYPAQLAQISAKGFSAVVNNNLIGGFLMSRELFTQSMQRCGGAIVNITADAVNGFPGMAHTGAARAGMENLTKTAAWEWSRYGVRVNAVAPGLIASSGLDTYPAPFQAKLQDLAQRLPLARFAVEAEVSGAVCFLLSPAASYINGETLRVDGAAQFGSANFYGALPKQAQASIAPFGGFHRAQTPQIFAANEESSANQS